MNLCGFIVFIYQKDAEFEVMDSWSVIVFYNLGLLQASVFDKNIHFDLVSLEINHSNK